jgi:hypothetical protein
MSKAVFVAVATEMDGHAMADAIRTTVSNYDSEEVIKNMIIKKLRDEEETVVKVTGITRDRDFWYLSGWYACEDYPFSAIVTPSNFKHINTGTG